MPIGLDTSESYPYVLYSDRQKPEESRPAFRFRFLTELEDRRVRERFEAAMKMPNDAEATPEIEAVIRFALVGWEKMTDRDGKPIPFDPSTCLDVLNAWEKVELAMNYPNAGKLTAKERAGFFSPSSPSVGSAGDAEPPASA